MKRHATSSEFLVERIEVIRREFDMNGTLLGRSACLCTFFERLIDGKKPNRAAIVTTDLDHGERRLGVVRHLEAQHSAVELNRRCDVGDRECQSFKAKLVLHVVSPFELIARSERFTNCPRGRKSPIVDATGASEP